jgi:hypothetical protein
LIVPAALETEADEIINTVQGYESEAGPGVANSFHHRLEVVTDAALDVVDDSGWYLAANPKAFDTVAVAYLDGKETPYIEEDNEFNVDAWSFNIRFCWGIKALDWRGLYFNSGAGS